MPTLRIRNKKVPERLTDRLLNSFASTSFYFTPHNNTTTPEKPTSEKEQKF
jgi:hypothetical protein